MSLSQEMHLEYRKKDCLVVKRFKVAVKASKEAAKRKDTKTYAIAVLQSELKRAGFKGEISLFGEGHSWSALRLSNVEIYTFTCHEWDRTMVTVSIFTRTNRVEIDGYIFVR